MYSSTRFHELLEAFPRSSFDRLTRELNASHYDKSFKPYDHLIALLYAQLSGAGSLRELEAGFNAQSAHHYHLGTDKLRRSTLSDANQRRDPALFKGIAELLMGQAKRKARSELSDLVYLLDSTPIQLKQAGFEWAAVGATQRHQGLKVHLMIEQRRAVPVYLNITSPRVNDVVDARRVQLERGACYVFDKGYCDYGWWHQIDQAGATFVTRFKANAAVERVETRAVDGCVVLADERVTFRHPSNRGGQKNPYHGKLLRRITVYRKDKKPLVLATNDLDSRAEEIADLYRQRWQIELFFKWIKQNLKVKRFLGRSRNAVLLQLYVAIISYLLLSAYMLRQSNTAKSLHLLLVELRETLFTRLPTEAQRHYRRRRREVEELIARRQHALPI